MADNKTRRNFLIGSVAVPTTVAAVVTLKQSASNAAAPRTKTVVEWKDALAKNVAAKDIYAERLSRFESEIHERSTKLLNGSPLFQLFTDYGFPSGSFKVQFVYMPDKMESVYANKSQKSTITDPALEESLKIASASGEEVVIHDCIICNFWCC